MVRASHAPTRNQCTRPPKRARTRWPSAHASIDFPLPPSPTSATRRGRDGWIALSSVESSSARPLRPTGGGGNKLVGREITVRELLACHAHRPQRSRPRPPHD